MKSMVVFFALCAVACGSLVAQPPHLPAIVLDPRGRPLDTAEVINSRALHLQAKALEGGYGHGAVIAPYALTSAYGYNAPLLAHAGLGHAGLGYAGNGHYLYKRSLGHYAAPAAAVSHQSRVDVISRPAVVSHAVAPLVSHAVAPVVSHALPAAVSHQSRVDVHSSPAIIAHSAIAPAAVVPVAQHGVLANINHAAVAPIGYAAPYNYGHGYYNSAPLIQAW
ncbi:unnamed protein product [Arctia plantaginis]|uniref:Cuticle protein n=1 Tax=Arctia plantaginis TaxID=874455 RepID=A0A8S1BID6_ARCPL|nr:unnamed protein product [Arctia plantaginis]CAB3259801.1 unnamed protein product [Arctia plantaginis]